MAFDRELPLVIVLQSHLPHVTTFRASNSFWKFLSRFLRVSRPPNGILSLLSSDHIVAHVDGDEAGAVTATLLEWNDAVIAWELDVRRRNENSRAAASGPIVNVGQDGNSTTSPRSNHQSSLSNNRESSDAHPVIGIGSSSSYNNNSGLSNGSDGVFWRALLAELGKQSASRENAAEIRSASEQRQQRQIQQQQQQQQPNNNNNNNDNNNAPPASLADYFGNNNNNKKPFDTRERVPL